MKDAAFFITLGLFAGSTGLWLGFPGRFFVASWGVGGWICCVLFAWLQICTVSVLLRTSLSNPGVLAKNSCREPQEGENDEKEFLIGGTEYVRVSLRKSECCSKIVLF